MSDDFEDLDISEEELEDRDPDDDDDDYLDFSGDECP